jgi:uncharacterized membrane protein
MALILYRSLFWILLACLGVILLWIGRRRRLKWLPAWLLRFVLIGIVLYCLLSPNNEPVSFETLPLKEVMILDMSDSISLESQNTIQEQAFNWQISRNGRTIVEFGVDAFAVLPEQDAGMKIDSRASNLHRALSLSMNLLGEEPGRIVLVTDGSISSIGPVEKAIEQVIEMGHIIEVIPQPTFEPANDLYVGDLWVPSSVWQLFPFDAMLPVYAPHDGEVELRFKVDDEVQLESVEELHEGENYLSFPVDADAQGITTLEASVYWEGDDRPENNIAFKTVTVFSPPNVLLATDDLSTAMEFQRSLVQSGLQVSLMAPHDLPTDLEGLEPYQVIILHNFLVSELTTEKMVTLEVFVSRRGRGLIFLGGQNSYTLGGYENTIIEKILPVKLEPPPRSERPPVTLVLAFDRSYSMSQSKNAVDGILPIDLAREAAMRAIETLKAQDILGVLTYSDKARWEVPIQPLGDGLTLRTAQDAVSRVIASGGTKMYIALEEIIENLKRTVGTETKHILLLSDGKSSDGTPEEFQSLAEDALQNGITISTIAIGSEMDPETMEMIANYGKGRYFELADPTELPRIMVSESKAARAENVQLGRTNLILGEDLHPILGGFSPAELPVLDGYNALSSKRDLGAEDVLLSSGFRDPVLSIWQIGLGRVAAWMGDLGEEWAGRWANWSGQGRFWSNIIRYTLPDPSQGPVQVDVSVEEFSVTVGVYIETLNDEPVNGAKVFFSYSDSNGDIFSYEVPQSGIGEYYTEIGAPPEGAYRGVVSIDSPNGFTEIAAPFEVNYPLEWRPVDPDIGTANLIAWSSLSGGRIIEINDLEKGNVEEEQSKLSDILLSVVVGMVVYWPLEIALRRRWLPWQ